MGASDVLSPEARVRERSNESANRPGNDTLASVVVGTLVGFADEGRTPLVMYPGQPGSAALAARGVVALHAPHIGKNVVLVFEGGNPQLPLVMGVLRNPQGSSLADHPGRVEIAADGERLIVTAKDELVLQCGRASITLTKDGKILLRGTYLSSHSSGVNRIKGGSVQLN